ncbi:MAG TPA: ferritin-like domain-containing protein [Microthrixaceae bacterium]|jgi:ferritin-like protein|nr:ferritin-like domain-containing protein [Microthrixaceae bacterium]
MSSEQLHEDPAVLGSAVRDRHRAIVSIMEELEAVDWYDQRVAAATDPELAAILAHNRDEEKEHAAMTLEWLRRNDPVLDRHLRTYLFSTGSVLDIEHAAEHAGSDSTAPATTATTDATGASGSLRIGDLKGDAS